MSDLDEILRETTAWFKSPPTSTTEKEVAQAHQFMSGAPQTSKKVYTPGENLKKSNKDLANEFKEKGNSEISKNQYTQAIASYTKAIELDPQNAVYPANRALAYVKSNDLSKAIADCNNAVKIDPTYSKAYYRRATTYLQMKKYKEAFVDFEKVLSLEPGNNVAVKELAKLKQSKDPQVISQLNSKPEQNTAASPKPAPTPAPSTQQPTQPKPQPKPTTSAVPQQSKPEPNKSQLQTKPTPTPAPTPQVRASQPLQQTIPSPAPTKVIQNSNPVRSNVTNPKPKVMIDSVALKQEMDELKKKPVSIPIVPPTSAYQFEIEWSNLHSDQDKYTYLKMINPTLFNQIFKDSIEENIFEEILFLVHQFYILQDSDVEGCCGLLSSLMKVKRFDILIMFLGDSQKQGLEKLFQGLDSLKANPELVKTFRSNFL